MIHGYQKYGQAGACPWLCVVMGRRPDGRARAPPNAGRDARAPFAAAYVFAGGVGVPPPALRVRPDPRSLLRV
jgi:hypothetical protein